MPGLEAILADNRAAVDDLGTAAERAADRWTTPPAPGRWSPSQVVEHVALAMEESAAVIRGVPSPRYPTLPRFIRPLVRRFFFYPILAKGTFPKAKTNKAMNPASGPASPAAGRERLAAARDRFEQACRTRAANPAPSESTVFGRVTLEEYARFVALHSRHHVKQVTVGAA